MHDNFYHWHKLKPDTALLVPRWEAAAKFGEKISSADIVPLLESILFPSPDDDFAKRFTSALIKSDPTFPPSENSELLRVMAGAAVVSRLTAKPSEVADAFALGLNAAANFPAARAEPISNDVVAAALEYLGSESERVRPQVDAGAIEKAEKQVATQLVALQTAVQNNSLQEIGKATEGFGRGVLAAVKESHIHLGDVIDRIAEETQFLWWLVGRRSSRLNLQRSELSLAEYSLVVAQEAADRVALLPPPASVEALLEEALAQCGKNDGGIASLSELIAKAKLESVDEGTEVNSGITPVARLVSEQKRSGKIDAEFFKQSNLSAKAKLTPIDLSRQYFRELVFLQAVDSVE